MAQSGDIGSVESRCASAERLSSAPLNISPGKQFVDSMDFVVGNAAEDIGQPRLWIDAIELGRLNHACRQWRRIYLLYPNP